MEDLAEQVKAGKIDFDVCIASPDAMRVVGQLGQILGPRGLMPNPKVGTVTPDVATAVKNAKAGQVQFRTDKYGIVHASIGRASFAVEALEQNAKALVDALLKAKPAAVKGSYLRKLAGLEHQWGGIRSTGLGRAGVKKNFGPSRRFAVAAGCQRPLGVFASNASLRCAQRRWRHPKQELSGLPEPLLMKVAVAHPGNGVQ